MALRCLGASSLLFAVAASGQEVWTSAGSGKWSNPTRWLDGTVPVSSETLAVSFTPAEADTISAHLDLDLLTLNRLTFEARYPSTVQVTARGGDALRFAGNEAKLTYDGISLAVVSAPIVVATPTLRVEGAGLGAITLAGAISEEGAARGLIIDMAISRPDAGSVQLSGANTFTGGVDLRAGNLFANHATALGTGALTVRGGSLLLGNLGAELKNDALLYSDLLVTGANGVWSGSITSAVAGTGLAFRGRGSLTLTGASTYTGASTIDNSAISTGFSPTTNLILSGNGSARQSPLWQIGRGGRLEVHASVAGQTDRLGDTATVSLRGGTLTFRDTTGNAAAKSETIGELQIAGRSTLEVVGSGATVSTLYAANVMRAERGSLFFSGLGTGAGNGRIVSAIAPVLVGGGATGGPATSIVPWAYGTAGGSWSFATYAAPGGFRMLDPAVDYAYSLTAGATQNVRYSGSVTLTGPTAVNSLFYDLGTIQGAGHTLSIVSGALVSGSSGSIAANVDFGAAEGHVVVMGYSFNIDGQVSGTNGLTKAGEGMLVLTAANSLSGPLTINSGSIRFSALDQLGVDPGPIVIHGGDSFAFLGTGLSYSGSNALNLPRPLALRSGVARVELTGASELTLSGGTQGPGGWEILSNSTGSIRLAGLATHTGTTWLRGGRVRFDSDSALGAGGDLILADGAVLDLGGNWSTNRRVSLIAPVALRANGHNVVLNGLLTGTGALTKTTAGNVRITGAMSWQSSIDFDSGRLEIGGLAVLKSGIVTMSGGAALVLDNATQADSDRFAGSGQLVLRDGELRLEGHASTAIAESVDRVTLEHTGAAGGSTISLTAPGTASTTLRIGALSRTAANVGFPNATPPLLIRGSQLGGPAGGAFTRVVVGGTNEPTGFRSDVLVEDGGGLATSFAIYDSAVDAAGPIGFRPLAAADYRSAASIQNPANGGATPLDAHLLLEGVGTAIGANNTAQTLTFGAGSALTLGGGQTLTLTRGLVIARTGAALASVSGGTLAGGAAPVSLYIAGDLQLAANITSERGELHKHGPGTLHLLDGVQLPATVIASDGVVRVQAASSLAASLISLAPSAALELQSSASVGGLAGTGSVSLGNHTLTFGTLPADSVFDGTINGAGSVRIVDGGRPETRRTLSRANTHTGGVILDSGVLTIGHAGAFGTGPLTVNGGALDATVWNLLTLNNPIQLDGTLDVRGVFRLGTGATFSGLGNVQVTGTGSLNLSHAVTLSGAMTVDGKVTYSGSGGQATISIDGAAGSLRPGGGIIVDSDGALFLNDTSAAYTGGASGRLSDTSPLTLRGGMLEMQNDFGAVPHISETVGALQVAGFSTIRLTPNSAGSTTLQAASLQRIERGTLDLQLTRTLGVAGAGSSFVQFAAPPATTDGGVVPYATATLNGTFDYYGVVVHDAANGLRLLGSAEYITTLAAANATSHLLVPQTGDLINAGNLTVRTLNLGAASTVIRGGGSLTITSGLVLGTSAETVDNSIHFGANEGFIAVPENFVSIDFLRPVTGSGGLTVYGRGTVSFTGGNQVSGQLVLNGSARVRLTDPAQLGPDPGPILVNGNALGAGFQVNTGSVPIARSIQVNSGYVALSAPGGGAELIMSGAIAGPGGVFIAPGYGTGAFGFGRVVLAGTNTYTGPTVVGGHLAFASDAALGNGGAIILSNGKITLLGDWTTSRRLEPSNLSDTALILDTNGFNATFLGDLASSTFVAPPITKRGVGALALPVPQDGYSGKIIVEGGEVVLGGDGRLPKARVEAKGDGLFVVDNQAQVAPRGAFPVILSGGEFLVRGHATQPTTLGGRLEVNALFSTLTLAAQPGVPVTLDYSTFYRATDAYALLRGTQLGGSGSRIRFAQPPALVNGLVSGLIVDSSATGGGSTFATYDTAVDALGVIGIRPLKTSELTAAGEIRNPSNGGAVATSANFLASGTVTAGGAANTLHTLTLDPGAQVQLGAGQTLTISRDAILVRDGAPAAITGGLLRPAGFTLDVFGGGELLLGATVPVISSESSSVRQRGPGVLTVTAPQPGMRFVVMDGSLRPGAGDPLLRSRVVVEATGRFELNGHSTRVGGLGGDGVVDLGGATLTLGADTVNISTQFYGSLRGTGGLATRGTSSIYLYGQNTFTGPLAVYDGSLTLRGTAPNITSLSLANSRVHLDHNDSSGAAKLPVVPVTMSSGWLQLEAFEGDSQLELGQLSGDALNTVTITQYGSSSGPTDTRMTFAGLTRLERGGFLFRTELNNQNTASFNFVADLSSQLVGNPAVPSQRPILPYALLNGRPATFEPGIGLRPLAVGEFTDTLTAGSNVRLPQDITFDGNVSVNSLDTNLNYWLRGTGTVHVTSGLVGGNGGRIYTALDFGGVEGKIFGLMRLYGPIHGTNGLTLMGDVELHSANDFTGPLTINSGALTFVGPGSLGADTSPIVLQSGGLRHGGFAAFSLTRGLDLRGGLNSVGLAFGTFGAITLAGPISGPGDLALSGEVVLGNVANSYSGVTKIGGLVRFPSDAAFGQSSALTYFNEPSVHSILAPFGDWTTARPLQLGGGAGEIGTGLGTTTTLNGPVTGHYQFTKIGPGRLVINDGDEFTGPIIVEAGALRVNGSLGSSGRITVAAGARLEGSAGANRPLTLNGTLAPGASAGTMEFGDATFGSGSTLELELLGPAQFDQLRIAGTVTFTGPTQLSLDLAGATFGLGVSFPILLNDGTDAIVRTAANAFAIAGNVLDENEVFFVGGQALHITYVGGDGNDIVLTVPEPHTTALLLLGLGGLALRRRRD